jgi:hypothetical protein
MINRKEEKNMIKVKNGLVEVSGTKEDIFADLSSLASYINLHLSNDLGKVKAQEKIILAVERGFLISKDMTQETAYEMQKLTEKINGR